jgi:cytochrome c-type biogenesis protein CcmH
MEQVKVMQRKRANTTRILIILALFSTAAAAAAGTAQDEKKAREIENNLIAPCCWTQPVSEHYSEVSDKIRKEVREMVAAGKSRDEILDYYVAQYGERILAAPRAKGFNSLAYILPWLALAMGAWLLILLVRKTRSPAPAAVSQTVPDSRYAQTVEQEIKELDE